MPVNHNPEVHCEQEHLHTEVMEPALEKKEKPFWVREWVQNVIFNVRWILILFYVGLVVVLGIYAYAYGKEVYDIVLNVATTTTDKMKVIALDTIDVVMVANLIKMIITGSYNSFVTKDHGRKYENVNSSTLKTKIATSVVVVASIHMLKMLIDNKPVSHDELMTATVIYVLFLLTAIVLGILEHLHNIDELEKEKHEGVEK